MHEFSHTKIDTYIRCPWKFKLRYLDRVVPNVKAKPLALGACMAAGVGKFRQTGSFDQAYETFVSQWAKDGQALDKHKSDDPLRSVERGVEILQRYCDQYPDDPTLFIRPEIRFAEEIADGIIFRGRIDGVARLSEDTLPDVAIDEDKTASRLGPAYFKNLKSSYQILWYLGIARKLGLFDIYKKQKPMCLMNAIYIHKDQFRFERDITIKSHREITMAMDELLNWITKIRMSIEHNLFPKADMNICSQYGGCEYLPLKNASTSIREGLLRSMYHISKETNFMEDEIPSNGD